MKWVQMSLVLDFLEGEANAVFICVSVEGRMCSELFKEITHQQQHLFFIDSMEGRHKSLQQTFSKEKSEVNALRLRCFNVLKGQTP
jgi:hypothetical protein